MTRAALLLLLLGLACAHEDRAALRRRPIPAAPVNGWARLPLDADAQRALQGAWIGDGGGRSVPFLVAREGLWEPQSLPLEHLLLGTDAAGRPTAEFSLKLPEGWQVGERESLHLALDLDGPSPWVAQVNAERLREGGSYIAYPVPPPHHLYDLGMSGSRRTLDLPWDGTRYRLTLVGTQGSAPHIKGLTVQARTRPEALEAELSLEGTLSVDPTRPGTWRVSLPESQRVVGLELLLAPPVAPLRPEIRLGEGDAADRSWSCGDLVWNLPALGTVASRIALPPAEVRTLSVTLPEGATPLRLRLLVRRQTLLFPAEAGQAYVLHLGGRAKTAPGNLGALPSIRTLAASAPLVLGAAEADDQGLPRVEGADQRARPWMPWVAALGLVALGLTAWRLFRAAP